MIPASLIGVALATLVALGVVTAETPYTSGCFGEPSWAASTSWSLLALSIVSALGASLSFAVQRRWPMLTSTFGGIAFSIGWSAVAVVMILATQPSC